MIQFKIFGYSISKLKNSCFSFSFPSSVSSDHCFFSCFLHFFSIFVVLFTVICTSIYLNLFTFLLNCVKCYLRLFMQLLQVLGWSNELQHMLHSFVNICAWYDCDYYEWWSWSLNHGNGHWPRPHLYIPPSIWRQ